jgi:hypothetical protein
MRREKGERVPATKSGESGSLRGFGGWHLFPFLTTPNRSDTVSVVISRRFELVAAVASFSAGGHPMSRFTRNCMAFSVRVGRSA